MGKVLPILLLPWVMLAVLMWLFSFGYHNVSWLAWCCFAACMAASLAASGGVAAPACLGGLPPCTSLTKRALQLMPGPFWQTLGRLSLVAAVSGMCLGLYCYEHYLKGYYVFLSSSSYTNVLPVADAGAFQDAGTIGFSSEAFVDVARSVGYLSGGHSFCVAPVVDTSAAMHRGGPAERRADFWAAGLDCCAQRQAFWCGEVHDPGLHGGLVLQGTNEMRPFHKAVTEATATYGLRAPPDALLVFWTANPSEFPESLRDRGVLFFETAVFSCLGAWLLLSLGVLLWFFDLQQWIAGPSPLLSSNPLGGEVL